MDKDYKQEQIESLVSINIAYLNRIVELQIEVNNLKRKKWYQFWK